MEILTGFLQLVDKMNETTIGISGLSITMSELCFGLPVIAVLLEILSPWSRSNDDDDE